eukprot:8110430-Prorocentrum_lima.AAC.1
MAIRKTKPHRIVIMLRRIGGYGRRYPNGIGLLLSVGELSQSAPIARVLNGNSAALEMVEPGLDSAIGTRFVLMRAHV